MTHPLLAPLTYTTDELVAHMDDPMFLPAVLYRFNMETVKVDQDTFANVMSKATPQQLVILSVVCQDAINKTTVLRNTVNAAIRVYGLDETRQMLEWLTEVLNKALKEKPA